MWPGVMSICMTCGVLLPAAGVQHEGSQPAAVLPRHHQWGSRAGREARRAGHGCSEAHTSQPQPAVRHRGVGRRTKLLYYRTRTVEQLDSVLVVSPLESLCHRTGRAAVQLEEGQTRQEPKEDIEDTQRRLQCLMEPWSLTEKQVRVPPAAPSLLHVQDGL